MVFQTVVGSEQTLFEKISRIIWVLNSLENDFAQVIWLSEQADVLFSPLAIIVVYKYTKWEYSRKLTRWYVIKFYVVENQIGSSI